MLWYDERWGSSPSVSHGPWHSRCLSRTREGLPSQGIFSERVVVSRQRGAFGRGCAATLPVPQPSLSSREVRPRLFCSELSYLGVVFPKCPTQGFRPLQGYVSALKSVKSGLVVSKCYDLDIILGKNPLLAFLGDAVLSSLAWSCVAFHSFSYSSDRILGGCCVTAAFFLMENYITWIFFSVLSVHRARLDNMTVLCKYDGSFGT